jgi:hypothetical protein
LANEIRAGLGQPEAATSPKVAAKSPLHPLDEQWLGKSVRQHVKEFAVVFGILFLIISGVKTYKGADVSSCAFWFGLAVGFTALGYVAPGLLRPLWRGWMKLAHYLSIVMTTVILSAAWLLGFMPMSLLVRVCGIKVINSTFRAPVDTYWEPRDPKYDDFQRLKRQY